MVEYTIDDIRGPTVAREMAQLKEFVLAQFNGAIADAEAAAAAAATAAANAVLANTVKKTGEASQSIAGDVAITGALDAAGIGSGSTPIVCGDLTAYGSVSLDDTVLQGNLTGADASALINLAGVGSVLVPAPTSNSEAATKKYVDDALDNYAPMVRTSNAQTIAGVKTFTNEIIGFLRYRWYWSSGTNSTKWVKIASLPSNMLHFFLEMDSRYDHTILVGSSADMFTKTHAVTAGSSKFRMIVESDGTFTLWFQLTSNYNAYYVRFLNAERYGSEVTVTISNDVNVYDNPTPGVSSFDSAEMTQ